MDHKNKMRIMALIVAMLVVACMCGICFAASSDVAGAVEATWAAAREQVVQVVNNVVFPVADTILAIMFFIKVGMCYFDYRKHGTFEFTGPAILFACLIFMLTAPLYIWTII